MGVHRDRAVRRPEDAVAEGVVEVLVGVDDRDDLAGAERPDVLDHLARGHRGRVGVDHEQPVGAADQGDVDVEPLVARHPDVVGDLGERHSPSIGQGVALRARSADAGVQLVPQEQAELLDGPGRPGEPQAGLVATVHVDPGQLGTVGRQVGQA